MKMSKVRLCWSYDLSNTERWLEEMADQGWILEQVHPLTRKFIFSKQEPIKRSFHLYYAKEKPFSNRLREEGWEEIDTFHHWQVLVNDHPVTRIKAHPARDGMLKRNTWHSYGYKGLILIFALMVLQFITVNLAFSFGAPVHIVRSPLWILTILSSLIVLGVLLLSIRNIVLIKKNAESFVRHEKKATTLNQGKSIKKYQLFWKYEPDRLEEWLEEMAAGGYQLVEVGKYGLSFVFVKAPKEHKAFVADFHLKTEPYYIAFHKENGWEKVYESPYTFAKWTIWARHYDGQGEKPNIYHLSKQRRQQAKKVFYLNAGFMMYMLLLNGWLLYSTLNWLEMSNLTIFTLLCVSFSSFLAVVFLTKTALYFLRLKA